MKDLIICVVALLFSYGDVLAQGTLTSVGGRAPYIPSGIQATTAPLGYVVGLALDPSGALVVSETTHHQIIRITSDGVLTVIAGSGSKGFSGDGGPAIGAQLNQPNGLAFDPAGNLFIADSGNNRIRKVDLSGNISTVAGNGSLSFGGDGGPATKASLAAPSSVAISNGVLYIADATNSAIRAVSGNGTISTFISFPGFSGNSGPGVTSIFFAPSGILYAIVGSGVVSIQNGNVTQVTSGSRNIADDGTSAINAGLATPSGLWADSNNTIYVSEMYNCKVRKIDLVSGIITTLAGVGNSNCGGSLPQTNIGDNGQAASGILNLPAGLIGDSSGNIWIADQYNYRVRRVSNTHQITTVAGTGNSNFYGNNIPAASALLFGQDIPGPNGGMVFDGQGTLYFADTTGKRIRKIDTSGIVSTVVDQLGAAPVHLAIDSHGVIYFSPDAGQVVYKIASDGSASRFAGGGNDAVGEGIAATSAFMDTPKGIAFDNEGDLWIIEKSRIRAVTPNGLIYTTVIFDVNKYFYLSGIVPAMGQNAAEAIAFDTADNLYLADYASLSMLPVNGTQVYLAYSFTTCPAVGGAFAYGLFDVHVDSSGYVYISNEGCIDRYAPDGTIVRVGGGGTLTAAEGLAATAVDLRAHAITLDSNDNLYVSGINNIWKISETKGCYYGASPATAMAAGGTSNSTVSVTAGSTCAWTAASSVNWITISSGASGTGNGVVNYSITPNPTLCPRTGTIVAAGRVVTVMQAAASGSPDILLTIAGGAIPPGPFFGGDGGPAANAFLFGPRAAAYDSAGNLYIADSGNHRIRKVTPDGIISTYAGNGTQGFSGDGGPAASATFTGPLDLISDTHGNLFFIADHRVRKIDSAGIITTVAGNGISGITGDGGPAISAQLDPAAIAVDLAGNLYVADHDNSLVREVTLDGKISRFAGNTTNPRAGDGGPATNAYLINPTSITTDSDGNVYIGQLYAIRRVTTDGIINIFGGGSAFNSQETCLDGIQATASALYPASMRWQNDGWLYVTEGSKIYRINSSGLIQSLAGSKQGYSGGQAINAALDSALSPVLDPAGNVVFADSGNNRIRKIAHGVTCSFSLSGPQSFTATGGTGTLTIINTQECPWMPSSSASFITIPSQASSGSGGGSFIFTVLPNADTNSRSGTITVGGLAFPISQGPLPVGIVTAGSASGAHGATVSIPLSMTLAHGVSFDAFTATLTLTPAGASQALAGTSLGFTLASGMPSATSVDTSAAGTIVITWTGLNPALSGARSIGNVTVNLPAVGDGDSYLLHLAASGSSSGTLLAFASGTDGTLTTPYVTYLVGDIFPFSSDAFGSFGDQSLNTVDLLALLRAIAMPNTAPAMNSDRFDAMDIFPTDGANRGGDCILNTVDLLALLRRVSGVDSSHPRRAPRTSTCPDVSPQARILRSAGTLSMGAAEAAAEGGWRIPVTLALGRETSLGGLAFAIQAGEQPIAWSGGKPSLTDGRDSGTLSVAFLDGGINGLLGYIAGSGAIPSRIEITGISAHDVALHPVSIAMTGRQR